MVLTPYVLLYALAGLISLWVGVLAWRKRDAPGGRMLAWAMLAVAEWALVGALELAAVAVTDKIFWSKVCYPGILATPVCFALFAAEYTRHEKWLTPRRLALVFVVPLVCQIMAITNEQHLLLWSGFTPGGHHNLLTYGHGPVYWWGVVGYSYLALVLATFLLGQAVLRFPGAYRRQAGLLLLMALIPWLGNIIYILRLGPPLDLAPMAFSISGLGMAGAIFYYRLLDLTPVARGLLIETLNDGVLVLDPEDRIVDINPAARRLLRAPLARDLIGQRAGAVLDYWPTLAALLLDKTHVHTELRIPGNPHLDLELTASVLIGPAHRIEGRLLQLRDIGDRKVAEEARLLVERRLQHSQRLESLSLMAGGIAHDFNNLLMIVSGNLALIEHKQPPAPGLRQYFQHANEAVERAAALTTQMLAYTGRGHLRLGTCDLGQVVARTLHLLPGSDALDLHLAPELPPLLADEGQMQQVVISLVTNAQEALPPVGGRVSVRLFAQNCSAADFASSRLDQKPLPGRFVVLEVQDNGAGMDADTQRRMFEPFFTTKFIGRGLGLSAVQGIVRGHGGAIQVTSAPGAGTQIRLFFPVQEPAERPPAPAAAAPQASAPLRGTVLIVDDEAAIRDIMAEMATHLGAQALVAGDGQAAIDIAKARNGAIDAVILDLTMPGLDGLSTFNILHLVYPQLRFIIASGYEESRATAGFPPHAIAGFLHKPCDLADVRRLLTRLLAPPAP